MASVLFESLLWPPAVPGDASAAPQVLADPDVGHVAERVHSRRPSGFSLTCGEQTRGLHAQSDVGSITFDAYDVPLLIDSGSANDPTEGTPSSSGAHNLVLLDGRGQLPAGRGRVVSGRIIHAHRSDVATTVTCDLAEAYNADKYNRVHHAIRHCVYVREPLPYLLLVDDVARPLRARTTFDQVLQTPPAQQVRSAPGQARMRVEFPAPSTPPGPFADEGVADRWRP